MKLKNVIFLVILIILFSVNISAETYFAGRSASKIEAAYWIYKSKKEFEKKIIADRGEVFACLNNQKEKKLYFGGALNNKGAIWQINYNDEIISYETPKESRSIYSLLITDNGDIYAGGLHIYLGGFVWLKKAGSEWEQLGYPVGAAMISSLAIDSKGRLFAGGFAQSEGKVWLYSNNKFDIGSVLNMAKEINCLEVHKDVIYAGGIKSNNTGGVWFNEGDNWKEGENLKFSTGIYASTINPEGVIYFVGAGDEKRHVWENSKGFWNAIELDDCISLYSIESYKDGSIYAAGWNGKRKGQVWIKSKKSNEWNAFALDDCFVIRSIS
ncbi:MAG: hypothetical protein ACD_79C00972G0006 [uncultured bacterium]|nr:MAG: hypothetical protein ACD_79C00972G0006 [uncultured bacterium]